MMQGGRTLRNMSPHVIGRGASGLLWREGGKKGERERGRGREDKIGRDEIREFLKAQRERN